MLHIGADGVITCANGAAVALLGDWIAGRSYDAALRQPALLDRIEAVLQGAMSAEALIERSERAGETQYKVRISAVQTSGVRTLLLHFTDITHLGEAEEMRRDFVANVSHELRTPLTSVMGFIETLRGPARNDPAAQERFLGIMEAEAQRMNRLIADLLSLSRVEAEARVRPSEHVDLGAILGAVVDALRPRADEAGNPLILIRDDSLKDHPALIRGDRDQLMQVFLNLTENALKYGGPGREVTLVLSRDSGGGADGRLGGGLGGRLGGRLGGGGLPKGEVLRVDVIDRGDGIASQHLPRLTERFYRIDSHRSRELGGTGLGLAIVKHIVNRHRGRLRIASEEGQGSTFSVIFPAI